MEQETAHINPAFVKFDSMTPEQLVEAMFESKERVDHFDALAAPAAKEFEYLKLVKIPTVFDERNIKNLSVKGLQSIDGVEISVRCSLTSDIYASIKAENREAAYEWLRDNGRSDLIKDTVAPGSLKSSAKAALAKGEGFPDELFSITPFTRAGLTKI